MKLGDVRYRAYVDTRDEHIWVCRCTVVALSPQGQSVTYENTDALEKDTFKRRASYAMPKSEVEALKEFQLSKLDEIWFPGVKTEDSKETRIKRIVEAQKLIDAIQFCPSI